MALALCRIESKNGLFQNFDPLAHRSPLAQHRRFRKPTLTPEEQAEQDAIADSIIDGILREEAGQ